MLIIHTTVNVLYVFVSEGESSLPRGDPHRYREKKKKFPHRITYVMGVMGHKANHCTTVPCMVILVIILFFT